MDLFFSRMESLIFDLVISRRERFQTQRVNLFLALMKPKNEISILDVGRGCGDFLMRIKDKVSARFITADVINHSSRVLEPMFDSGRQKRIGISPYY